MSIPWFYKRGTKLVLGLFLVQDHNFKNTDLLIIHLDCSYKTKSQLSLKTKNGK